MATVATPVLSPTGGKKLPGASVTITCATENADIYYTFGDGAPSTEWELYVDGVTLPASSGTTTKIRAYAVKVDSDDSAVASGTFYTVGFSGAVGANAVAILDTNTSQALGAVCEGIGKSGSDNTSISGRRIGASSTTTDLKYETGTI